MHNLSPSSKCMDYSYKNCFNVHVYYLPYMSPLFLFLLIDFSPHHESDFPASFLVIFAWMTDIEC